MLFTRNSVKAKGFRIFRGESVGNGKQQTQTKVQ